MTEGEREVLEERLLDATNSLANHRTYMNDLSRELKRTTTRHVEMEQEVMAIQREMSTPWGTEDD